MSFTSFQNYLSNTYDDSNENNWFSGNIWGQFVNIEAQFVTQIRDTVLSLSKSNVATTYTIEIPKVKSIPRIKSIKTFDLESNATPSPRPSPKVNINSKEKEIKDIKDIKENIKVKYTYISVTGILFCLYIYVNIHL